MCELGPSKSALVQGFEIATSSLLLASNSSATVLKDSEPEPLNLEGSITPVKVQVVSTNPFDVTTAKPGFGLLGGQCLHNNWPPGRPMLT